MVPSCGGNSVPVDTEGFHFPSCLGADSLWSEALAKYGVLLEGVYYNL